MKALSFWLPWGPLVVSGRKTLETRKGPVLNRFTGTLAIAISQKSPKWEEETTLLTAAFGQLDGVGVPPTWPYAPASPHLIPPDGFEEMSGHVIGLVDVGRTRRFSPLLDSLEDVQYRAVFLDVQERYLTEFTNPRWLKYPVPAKGRLGLWDVEIPKDAMP